MNNRHHIRPFLLTILCFTALLFSSCSTKKNTATTRGYHQMTTAYNIYFNANQSYIDGMKVINKGNIDDYSRILPMYAISNPENISKASSQMDKTIEKCRKSITKHSITKKPKRDKKKWKDPKYQYFYNQEEFVAGVKRSWITLGQAEIHKGDFIGAVGTFSYITRHYPSDHNIICEARIWLSRAYAELGWIHEAEGAFEKIKENDVNQKLTGLYAATKADILMKQQKYAEAYPYLSVAAKKEKNKTQRTRFYYILGQIALQENKKEEASKWFAKVKKATPPYIMELNTKLNLFSSQSDNKKKALKGLNRMANHPNNIEYLDQVYHSIGDVYLANQDTANAIKAYQQGATESVRNGKDKAALLIKTGDLFLERKQYVDAFPCFQEASPLIDISHPDYRRVEKYGTVLGEVALNYNMVVLQDSLQHLATLSEKEQLKIIEDVIAQAIADEKEAERLAKEAEQKANTLSRRAANRNSMAPSGGLGANKDWYFYNDNLKQSGLAQFQQKWGKRKLEDNWRRANKTASSSFDTDGDNFTDSNDTTGFGNDSSSIAATDITSSDNKSPEFYLAQIPTTKEEITASNKQIAGALYKLGEIYATSLEDYSMALSAYQDFESRFGSDSLIIEVLYACYRISGKTEDNSELEHYRTQIISRFPNSTYAMMLSQPDYIDRMKSMFAEQDSIYQNTYTAYSNSEFDKVKTNYAQMKEKYPLSELLPKFALLNALSIGRTTQDSTMFAALTEIVTLYPESDVAPMCKDILALMSQGKDAQQGSNTNSLANKRQQSVQAQSQALASDSSLIFTYEEKVAYEVYIIPKDNADSTLNSLLYNIALFNFTKFLVKDYDLAKESIDNKLSIKISGLTNHEEALWYETMLLADPILQGHITLDMCERVIISADNATKITKGLTLDEYKDFLLKNK